MKMNKGLRKFFAVLGNKFVILAFIFIIVSLATVFAGNVIVKDGSFTAEDSFNASNALFVNQTTDRVGIGTASPGYKLHIYDSGISSLQLESSGNYAELSLNGGQAGDVTWLLLSGYPNAGDFNIREYGVGNYFTIKKTTGNIGIKTSTPQNALNVIGEINATQNIYSNGQRVLHSANGSQTFTAGSPSYITVISSVAAGEVYQVTATDYSTSGDIDVSYIQGISGGAVEREVVNGQTGQGAVDIQTSGSSVRVQDYDGTVKWSVVKII